MDIRKYLQEKKEIVDLALEKYVSGLFTSDGKVGWSTTLQEAIHYSLSAGGKRIRPILSIAAFEALGEEGDEILPFACGLEMIHTYSLIHDDLPAMDDDDYRRGKLTSHKVFGEAIAILAGDALLTEAFRLMTDPSHLKGMMREEGVVLELVNEIAQAAGVLGMVGGQALDIESEGREIDLSSLEQMHGQKTGKLISVSVRVGARLGGAREEVLKRFNQYGERIGLAFQITDDILNVEGKSQLMGKRTGSDLSKKKATYPSLLGLEASKERAKELVKSSIDALNPFGPEADPLREIARFIILREN